MSKVGHNSKRRPAPPAKQAADPVNTVENGRAPTEKEAAAISQAKESLAARPARPAVSYAKSEGTTLCVTSPHSDGTGWTAQLTDVFGTSSEVFANQAFTRMSNAVGGTKAPTEPEVNAALALMAGIAPRDELEAAIGEQIIASHAASLDLLHRARQNAGKYVEATTAYVGAATKLTRTMNTLVETLAKLRSGGKQQVEVRYVYVDARYGQNIIGSQIGGGAGVGNKNAHQPHVPCLSLAEGVSMWGPHPGGLAVPTALDAEQATLPTARGQEPGSAEGCG